MNLQDWRELNGLNREECGLRLDVTSEAVRLWEAGQRVPRPDQMRRIIALSNGAVTPNDFYQTVSARTGTE